MARDTSVIAPHPKKQTDESPTPIGTIAVVVIQLLLGLYLLFFEFAQDPVTLWSIRGVGVLLIATSLATALYGWHKL